MQLGEGQNMSFFHHGFEERGGKGRGCNISVYFLQGYTRHYYYYYYYYYYSKGGELNRLSTYFTLSFFPS